MVGAGPLSSGRVDRCGAASPRSCLAMHPGGPATARHGPPPALTPQIFQTCTRQDEAQTVEVEVQAPVSLTVSPPPPGGLRWQLAPAAGRQPDAAPSPPTALCVQGAPAPQPQPGAVPRASPPPQPQSQPQPGAATRPRRAAAAAQLEPRRAVAPRPRRRPPLQPRRAPPPGPLPRRPVLWSGRGRRPPAVQGGAAARVARRPHRRAHRPGAPAPAGLRWRLAQRCALHAL
jgi:hypothetical protein